MRRTYEPSAKLWTPLKSEAIPNALSFISPEWPWCL